MGNNATKHHVKERPKKNVHWKSAEPPSMPGKPILITTENETPDVITLKWERSKSDGGSPIIGFLVEHRRMGSPHWVRATPSLIQYPELSLSGLEPGWRYQFRVTAENIVGCSEPSELSDPLTVTLQRNAITSPRFTIELPDVVTAIENEKIEFNISVTGTPTPQINWFKDGFEIFSSRRTKIINDNNTSTLIIHQASLTDEGEIKCTATNRAGHIATRAQLKLEAPPKIRLPRQYEDGLIIEADEIIRLKVGLAGRPAPSVQWTHNGEVITSNDRYELQTTDKNSSLKIVNCKRFDRGEYNLRATNKLGIDNASFLVTITSRPSAPSKITISSFTSVGRNIGDGSVTNKSVQLSWIAPDDDGGCKIGNYIVEYFRCGWNVWLKALTTRQLTCTLNDLIDGSEYKFRVKAENPYGVSDPSPESEILFVPDLKRGILNKSKAIDMDDKIAMTINAAPDEQMKKPILIPRKHKTSSSNSSSKNSLDEKPNKVDKQEQTKIITLKITSTSTTMSTTSSESPSTAKKQRTQVTPILQLTSNQCDNETITREMSYGTSADIFNRKKDYSGLRMNIEAAIGGRKTETDVTVTSTESKKFNRESLLSKEWNLNSQKDRDQRDSISDRPISPLTPSSPQPPSHSVTNNQLKYNDYLDAPRDSADEVHTSNEFVLVVYDDDQQKSNGRKNQSSFDLDLEDAILPPPVSLSLPDLLRADPLQFPQLQRSASSTELIYTRAMARFYQAVEYEKSVAENSRKHSLNNSIEALTGVTDTGIRRHSLASASSVKPRNIDDIQLRKQLSDDLSTMKNLSGFQQISNRYDRENKLKLLNQDSSEDLEEIHYSDEPINSNKINDNKFEYSKHEDQVKQQSRDDKNKLDANADEDVDVDVDDDDVDDLDDRDLIKEILESERKFNISRSRTPISNLEYDSDYTESTASTASSASVESLDPMCKTTKQRTETQQNVHTTTSTTTTTTTTTTNNNNINDNNNDSISNNNNFSNNNNPTNITRLPDVELETYHPRMVVESRRAMSPYRSPEPDQSTINLTKPLPLPDPDFVPKPILKRSSIIIDEKNSQNVSGNSPTSEKSDKKEKKKQNSTSEKSERKSLLQLFERKKTPSIDGSSNKTAKKIKNGKEKLKENLPITPAKQSSVENNTENVSRNELAKRKSLEIRQSSIEENQVVVDHYNDLVKEFYHAGPSKVPIYLNKDAVAKVTERAKQEIDNDSDKEQKTDHKKSLSPPPAMTQSSLQPLSDDGQKVEIEITKTVSLQVNKIPKEHRPFSPTSSRSSSQTRTVKESVIRKQYSDESPPTVSELNKQLPKTHSLDTASYINSDVLPQQNDSNLQNIRGRERSITRSQPKRRDQSGSRTRSNSALRKQQLQQQQQLQQSSPSPTPKSIESNVIQSKRSNSKTRIRTESQSSDGNKRALRSLHLTRVPNKTDSQMSSPASTPPLSRPQTPEQILEEVEINVKSTMNYITDLGLFFAACWIYMFKDARLAIPILILMVYRQLSDAVKDKLPKWTKRKRE